MSSDNNSGSPNPKFKIGDKVKVRYGDDKVRTITGRYYGRLYISGGFTGDYVWIYTLDDIERPNWEFDEDSLDPVSDNNSSSSTTTTTTTTNNNNNNNNNSRPQPKFKVGDIVAYRFHGAFRRIIKVDWLLIDWQYTLETGETYLESDLVERDSYLEDLDNSEYKITVAYTVDYHNPLELEEWQSLLTTVDNLLEIAEVDSGRGSSVTITVNTNKITANKKTYLARMIKVIADTLAEKFNEEKYKDYNKIKEGLMEADREYVISSIEANDPNYGKLGDYAYATVLFADEESSGKILVKDKLDTEANGFSEAKEMPDDVRFGFSFFYPDDNDNNNNMMKKPPPKESNELDKEKKYIEKKLKRAKEKNEQLKEKRKEAVRIERRSNIELKSVKAWNKKLKNITLEQFQELKEASRTTQMKKCRNEDAMNLRPWEAEDFTNTIFLRFKMKDGKEETYKMGDGTEKPTTFCVADSRADLTIDVNDKPTSKDEMVFNMLFANWVEKGVKATGSKVLLHGKEGDPYDTSVTYKKNGLDTLRMGKGGKPGNERYVKITTVFNGVARYFRFDDKLKTIIKVKNGDGSVFYTEEDRQQRADMSKNSEIGFQLERGWKYPLAVYCEYDKTIAIGNIVASSGRSETHGNRVEDVYKVVSIATFKYFEDVEDILNLLKPNDKSGSSSGAKRKKPGLKF